MIYRSQYDSPVGPLFLESDGEALTGLWMNRERPAEEADIPVLNRAKEWLDAYFRGEAPEIGFPLKPKGTAFQQAVWKCLMDIPLGGTTTYGTIAREIAALMGRETMSAQAVGQAVGANPISIIIPCHRVIGAKGQLIGYAGGLEKKVWLLRHEGWLENLR